MRTAIAIAITAAVALTSCHTMRDEKDRGFVPAAFTPHAPKVYVIGNKIVVDQEPIVFVGRGKIQVRWVLQHPDYKFDAKSGISFEPKPVYGAPNQVASCAVDSASDAAFTCENENSSTGKYRYNITVVHRKTGLPLSYDPTFVND
jgi:hypothetical protein